MTQNLPPTSVGDVVPTGDQLHTLKLTDALQNLSPRPFQVVTFGDCNIKQSLDCFHVLRLHLTQVIEESELGKSGDECVAFKLKIEEARDADGTFETVQTKFHDLIVLGFLQWSRKSGQE